MTTPSSPTTMTESHRRQSPCCADEARRYLATETARPVYVRAVNDYDRAIEEAARGLLAHHDRQNGVTEGSANDCEPAIALRSALASRLREEGA